MFDFEKPLLFTFVILFHSLYKFLFTIVEVNSLIPLKPFLYCSLEERQTN